MLTLKHISKDYNVSTTKVHALRDVSLSFRQSEFVAVLGPSGGGKTTLLNIIGGLDSYSSGELTIGGISTKKFKNRDWDAYRNHTVGFIFQSYNLIPHQSVLANVELALTISGVSRGERRRRAREALERVGLGDQLSKKPNQLSGGQMQRVAIARALVNNPEVLLADEPTGALDTETSIQVMELIREIAKDRLVIMVTHNPDLAQAYATRIVRIQDGRILDDTNPYSPREEALTSAKKFGHVTMSYWTALSLSLKNLMTKKGRTFMTSFAGSIGIIGIALILSLSTGINAYIQQIQEETLSSYPIQIMRENTDTLSLMTSMMEARYSEEGEREPDSVYASTILYDMFNSVNRTASQENNLKDFKVFLDADPGIAQYASAVQYIYDLKLPIYTEDATGAIIQADFAETMQEAMEGAYGTMTSSAAAESMMSGSMEIWQEMLAGEDSPVSSAVTDQYDLIYGAWPQKFDEVVLIVNEHNEIADMILYSLGFKDSQRLPELISAAMEGEEISDVGQEAWTFEEVCGKEFKLILPAEMWQYQAETGSYTDMTQTESGMDYLYHADSVGTPLHIVGVIRPKEDATATMLTGTLGYTAALSEYVMEQTASSSILLAQEADETVDVFTGLPFLTQDTVLPTDSEKAAAFQSYLKEQNTEEKAEIYRYIAGIAPEEYLDSLVQTQMADMTREEIEAQVKAQYADSMGVDADTVSEYIQSLDDETLFARVEEALREAGAEAYGQQAAARLSAAAPEELALALDAGPWTDAQYAVMYDEFMPPQYSEATLEENYEILGRVDPQDPSQIHLYASTFADKDQIAERIAQYNQQVSEENQISYTDYVALLMSAVTDIISGISYLLIAFLAISLIVSSIMIGIITYISVLERTREIGILRSIGASKRDVSHVFNAETLIVGFVSGAIGIGASLLLNLVVNYFVHKYTGLTSIQATLPLAGGLILVCISMLLTWIAGLIPSRFAARRDPVKALRSE